MDYRTDQILAPSDVKRWAPFELARSFDRWLDARGIDYLEVGEGQELECLRFEWLRRHGGELDRLRFEWLGGEPGAKQRAQT
jgi:hypothetical protein